jgi:hypothetical protein
VSSQQQFRVHAASGATTPDRAGVVRPAGRSVVQIVMAWMKLWCFRPIKLLIGIGYVIVITEGLRMVVPALGIKLYSLPLLGALRDYEGWHELDLAPFVAVLLFFFSSTIWCALLETWLYDGSMLKADGRQTERYETCLLVLGSIILFADACLFYRAMTFVGWGGAVFSISALLCTLAYLAILVSVCLVSVNLKRNYLSLKLGVSP